MKRPREEAEEGDAPQEQEAQPAGGAAAEPAAAAAADGQQQPEQQQQAEDDEDDDKPLLANYKMSRSVRKGAECPYLDTISRQVRPLWWSWCWSRRAPPGPQLAPPRLSCLHSAVPASPQNLDFDFEKCCSVTLSGHNVYACLVCGKYFQVRAQRRQLHRAVVLNILLAASASLALH